MNVESRRILVTGASSGIGKATAECLVRYRARVATFDVAPLPPELAHSPSCRHWQVDVASNEAVDRAVSQASDWLGGGIDVLLHVAGIMLAQQAPIDEVTLEEWDKVIDVNLRGAFIVVRHVVPRLPASGGALILVSSVAGVFLGSGSFPYGASKGGIHGFALTLEEKLAPRGIRVNEVAPGSVDTPLLRRSLDEATARLGNSSLRDDVSARWVEPRRIAELLAFLASPDADVVRGTVRTW